MSWLLIGRAPAPTAGAIVAETLEAVAREGAQQMLQRALENEVHWFLGTPCPCPVRPVSSAAPFPHTMTLALPKVSADQAHDLFLGMLEPDQMDEAHVNLIQHGRLLCHARRPECGECPIRPRCRYVDPKAP